MVARWNAAHERGDFPEDERIVDGVARDEPPPSHDSATSEEAGTSRR